MWKIFAKIFGKKEKIKTDKEKVCLLGGSFDPVHNGHKQMARRISDRFDKVYIVPAKISPFKLDNEMASDSDRLVMLTLALRNLPKVEINDFEIKKSGISYSYLTIKHFTNENTSLFYAIGSEMLYDLKKWKNFEEIIRMVTFFVIPREGYEIDQELVNDYERMGAKIQIADFSIKDFSSAKTKIDISFNKKDIGLDPEVLNYIRKYNLYDDYKYITNKYGEFSLTKERIEHIYRAAMVGIKLSKIHNVCTKSVITAILLHDITKAKTKSELIEEFGLKDFEIDETLPHPCVHAVTASEVARQYFGITDDDIIDAIKFHTTKAPFMTELQKIVALADYTESGRKFDGIDSIRALSESNLNLAMEEMLKSMIAHLDRKKIHKSTIDAYDYFKMINNKT